jgi:hypothetical protein
MKDLSGNPDEKISKKFLFHICFYKSKPRWRIKKKPFEIAGDLYKALEH